MIKKLKPRAGFYRTSDIAKCVDRTSVTVIEWEKKRLIPKAKKDSRGWRMYSKKDVDEIVRLVKKTHYFSR